MDNKAPFLNTDSSCGIDCGMISPIVAIDKLPYKAARFGKHTNMGKTRYFIEYWAWQPDTKQGLRPGKLKRKRTSFDLNDIPPNQVERRAQQLIDLINAQLKQGMHIPAKGGGDQLEVTKLNKMTLIEAMKYALDIKYNYSGLKKNTKNHYKSVESIFLEWANKKQLADINIKKFTPDHALTFFQYLIDKRQVAPKTYNNYRGALGGLFTVLLKHDKKLFEENPINSVDKMKVKATKHAALNDEQMRTAIAFFKSDPEREYMALVAQMIYYTLARPNEIRLLKVGDIDLIRNQILIDPENSKTDLGYCGIPPALKQILIDSGRLKYPETYYLFGNNKLPGPDHYGEHTFYRRNTHMLEKTGLNKLGKRFALYSYKHSGAISLYRATKDIKLLQRQMRHKNLEQTNAYLRDLGLLTDFEGLNNWQGAI